MPDGESPAAGQKSAYLSGGVVRRGHVRLGHGTRAVGESNSLIGPQSVPPLIRFVRLFITVGWVTVTVDDPWLMTVGVGPAN